jgi:hypothetical protein
VSIEDALARLLKALPRCCNCQTAIGAVIDFYRWPLCEKCWKSMPGSDVEKPSVDMRAAVQEANRVLRISLANSLAKVPSFHEIPPPPSNPPEAMTVDLEEIAERNRKLRRKIRDMRETNRSAVRRIAVFFFFAGVTVAVVLAAVLHHI